MGRIHGSQSLYLRQHADQPVDWWPFGDEAFAEAARRDVPVFISIGYAACHWCHVMAAESFDDPVLAEYLNAHFVPIKVDREERPDVDAVYMAATQTLTGQGGWPMSVFTMPDGRPMHAGTYFPPRPRGRQPSFRQVLEAVAEAWQLRRAALEQQATTLAEHLGSLADVQRSMLGADAPAATGPARTTSAATVPGSEPAVPAGRAIDPAVGALPTGALPAAALPPEVFAACLQALEGMEAPDGGFGPAPKFPPSSALDFLLQHAASAGGGPGGGRALELAGRTLETMALGALHDHVGGGFARYCVDAAWRIPHFEKMLYDNAQLLRHLARWACQAGSAEQRRLATRAALDTARFLHEDLLLPGGGLASSLDADTTMPDGRHVEGGTYLFSRRELADLAGGQWPVLEPLLDGAAPEPGGSGGGAGGVDEPRTVAFARVPSPEQWRAWDAVLPALRTARAARPQPGRDEKVVAAWNGLAVQALAHAAVLLEQPHIATWAEEVAGYLWGVHWRRGRDGVLARVSYQGQPGGDGQLEDYAATALGFQAVGAASGDPAWFDRSRAILAATRERFLAPEGPVDAAGGEAMLAAARAGRPGLEPLDDAVPSGVALLASALAAQSALDGDAGLEDEALRLVGHVARFGPRAPQAMGTALAVAERLAAPGGPPSVAIAGGTASERRAALRLAILAGATAALDKPGDPRSAAGRGGSQTGAPASGDVSLLEHRPAGPGGSLRVYVCHGQVCRAPLDTVDDVGRELRGAGPAA